MQCYIKGLTTVCSLIYSCQKNNYSILLLNAIVVKNESRNQFVYSITVRVKRTSPYVNFSVDTQIDIYMYLVGLNDTNFDNQ